MNDNAGAILGIVAPHRGSPRALAGLQAALAAGASAADIQAVCADALRLESHKHTHGYNDMILSHRIALRAHPDPRARGRWESRAEQILAWSAIEPAGRIDRPEGPRAGERGALETALRRHGSLLALGFAPQVARLYATRLPTVEFTHDWALSDDTPPHVLDSADLPTALRDEPMVAVYAMTADERTAQRLVALGISIRDVCWMPHDGHFVVTAAFAEQAGWRVDRYVTPGAAGTALDESTARLRSAKYKRRWQAGAVARARIASI